MYLLMLVTDNRPLRWIGLIPATTRLYCDERQSESTVLRDSFGTAADAIERKGQYTLSLCEYIGYPASLPEPYLMPPRLAASVSRFICGPEDLALCFSKVPRDVLGPREGEYAST